AYDCPPFGKTRAHLPIIRQAVAQTIESFSNSLPREICQTLRTGIYFDAGYDSLFRQYISQGCPGRTLLVDSLVLQDDAADERGDIGCGKEHFAIVTATVGR